MTEIRVRWSYEVGLTKFNQSDGGLWKPETPQNREDFEVIVEAGNASYGEGTHWIEQREA